MIDLTVAQHQLAIRLERARGNKIKSYFRDAGPFARDLYAKHLEFFAAGTKYRERLMLAANRVGKTESCGLYELTLHLTGRYPKWWQGRRFTQGVHTWVAGDTKQTVREILQTKLLGAPPDYGTGVLPRDSIYRVTRSSGVADAVETVYVRHESGSLSDVTFKSYDQGRKVFQGTEKDVILLDEEPPIDVYSECLLRTMTNNGMIMSTFTPLQGLSDVVMMFLPDGELKQGEADGRYIVMLSWDDVPHLSQKDKDELYASIPPYQRDARSKGIPQLGSGAIYPVPESEIVVPHFEIPKHWPKAYAMDVGWNKTAAVWVARDLESGVDYLYSEHYQGNQEPSTHAQAIKARGDWMAGVIDPAARGRSQKDGSQLLQQYADLGLHLSTAKNAVEAGIYDVWERLSGGRLKVFDTMRNFLSEYRIYRRDDKGRVVKKADHLMDAMRYLVVSGLDMATTKPAVDNDDQQSNGTWMG